MQLSDSTLLGEARALLRATVEEGERCPCCTQYAKVYRRRITCPMAKTLVAIWLEGKWQFVHTPSLPGDTHEASQLSWWGLIEEELVTRPDGGRAGWWRITPVGEEFVKGLWALPKYARIYDGRCLGLTGDLVTIHDALGTKFSLAELMAA